VPEEPGPLVIMDLEALRALAHPRRQRILRHLGLHGPATSASLARELGLNTGATSYHLRELAKHGFVEEASPEAPQQAHGRERWWRAAARDFRLPPRSAQDPSMRAMVDETVRLEIAEDVEQFTLAQSRRDELGEWADALPHARGSMRLTLDELRDFFDDYIALVSRYKRPADRTPADARTVLTRFFAFPEPPPDRPADGDGSSTRSPSPPGSWWSSV
jgi:predicted ArsR family transcriptional regulator